MKYLVINGPNINMLGIREPSVYGSQSYAELLEYIRAAALNIGVEAIVDIIQWAYNRVDGIVINPAAYTHTSIAILDALKAVALPAVEVHLSDVGSREEYRKKSYVSEACLKTIAGKGFEGYKEALVFLKAELLRH
jgi:3-dehydroquinate dehydratase-2